MNRPRPILPFAISLLYVGDLLDVRVGGSLDTVGANLLLTAVEHLVLGGADVTLDLAEVDLVDAAGARAVATLASRAGWAGTRLTVRSASVQARAILRFSGFGPAFDYELGASDERRAVLTGPVAGAAAGAAELLLAQVGPRDHPYAVADAALRLVTTLAQATVAGADGVSVSLHRLGELMTVAASDERIAQMDRDQYATGQGPCLTAAMTGKTVIVDALIDETRWPEFVPRALMGGIASVLSSPLQSPGGPVGALNMYSKKTHGFGARERDLASLFAEQASSILTEAGGPQRSSVDGSRVQAALQTRSTIAKAQGVLMARRRVSAEEAYVTLKLDARSAARSVHEVAAEVLDSTSPTSDRAPRG